MNWFDLCDTMPDDATKRIKAIRTDNLRLQPSIICMTHAITALMFGCSGTKYTTPRSGMLARVSLETTIDPRDLMYTASHWYPRTQISQTLHGLHWLPIRQRIDFKDRREGANDEMKLIFNVNLEHRSPWHHATPWHHAPPHGTMRHSMAPCAPCDPISSSMHPRTPICNTLKLYKRTERKPSQFGSSRKRSWRDKSSECFRFSVLYSGLSLSCYTVIGLTVFKHVTEAA